VCTVHHADTDRPARPTRAAGLGLTLPLATTSPSRLPL
jgi:hypothetical protein